MPAVPTSGNFDNRALFRSVGERREQEVSVRVALGAGHDAISLKRATSNHDLRVGNLTSVVGVHHATGPAGALIAALHEPNRSARLPCHGFFLALALGAARPAPARDHPNADE